MPKAMAVSHGAGGTRTHDLRFRKPSLYPAELQPLVQFTLTTTGQLATQTAVH